MTAKKITLPVQIDINDSWPNFIPLSGDEKTWNSVYAYLNKLSKTKIPVSSCVRELTCIMRQSRNVFFQMHKSKYKRNTFDLNSYGALISIHMEMGHMTCKANRCKFRIASGNCHDKFVIENIGKVFFADKYKDKTK